MAITINLDTDKQISLDEYIEYVKNTLIQEMKKA